MSDVISVFVKCVPCGHEISTTADWFLLDLYTCENCGRTFDLDKDEDDENLEISYTDYAANRSTIYWYLAPLLTCECRARIELPYSNLPQTDEKGKTLSKGEDPPELPSEGWSATFGCRECGRIIEYFYRDVTIGPIPKMTEGTYQSGKGVYRAEFPCGDRRCTTPVSMYVDIKDRNASEAVELLRSGLFDGKIMPCGHEMKTVPAPLYKVEPVLRRLW